ncbi:acetyl-CoA carboxylase biotin carboxylase subunit [Burkholderia sp. BCC1977]|uniref:acetyl/propionyl/methylcrotonyl-CoA carboxylase subunit alpha n=1 Tax=Burkholderia sp. BCC1977 TaxID=2817440 RepID=UPI002ABE51AA|nr:acetyl-CoA carboxylase biotin carboxylase subunit [Burkholderia sp. BCC1977]
MFHKILIANRGEIALRVIRTARAMGYQTVAAYSTADARSVHVREADQAVCIGDPLPAESYLRIDAVIEAARRSGADAVHPGYGFLAENEDFAQACLDAGLVFIGPSPRAIVEMGNKAGAKRLMMAAGVPCVPGYEGEDQTEQTLAEQAERIGYPVMIKATAGGGGRGMRLVHSSAQFVDALHSAKSEAKGAFGDDEVILERAIVEPRHIEIQVFADRHGNAIHLGERDCSVQRRHQKVIEEAPSPAVDLELRARMGSTAVAAVKAIGYEGAGTLEFLLDRDGNYYFMEMNTRLQVEHPVTEAITGLDLVELQLRVATGEPLPLTQDDVELNGHAIEVRLCAESVPRGFIPQSGKMLMWSMPGDIRVEHALEAGSEISPYYDSMIAKLITHGPSREDARRKMVRALGEAVALGVETNQVFLRQCLMHESFIGGQATTGFIAANHDALLKKDEETDACAQALGVALLYATAYEHHGDGGGMSPRLPIAFRFEVDTQPCVADVAHHGNRHYVVRVGERTFNITLLTLGKHHARFVCDGLMEQAEWRREAGELWLHFRGRPFRVEDKTHSPATLRGDASGDGRIRASMNGRVMTVFATEGDIVEVGQPVITLEAMKMEHVHVAPVSGRLLAVHVKVGDQVAAHRIVAEIERNN